MSDNRDGQPKRFPLTLSDLTKASARPDFPSRQRSMARAAASVTGTAAPRVPVATSAKPTSPRSGHLGAVACAKPSLSGGAPQRGVAGTAWPGSSGRDVAKHATSSLALTSERVRARMVERVRDGGVTHPGVLAALQAVPRHAFVDAALAPQAYEEAALPIGHHQTISKPGVVARMIEVAMHGRPHLARVLEVGTGCGYQAAVLSHLAQDVFSIERIRPLHERAKRNLRPLRVPNIRLHYGDGRLGLPDCAPFDAIIVAAAGLDVPAALTEQLRIGGRLIAPVGGDSQVLTLVERLSAHQWRETVLDKVFFVPLKSGVI
ncbi:protein-L-isoaspartate(D-aspartate) O-methyltransferase [Robbsia andropogonis]|uniref:protein-L-isoaspartate(D-aspartate) O-methyltransferase n=1 Tax=Robbsia andropogonis TaxID=28092 RepID=UPI00209D0315|nr:protein-L-isoaspartate(D-aspartate) O-methyltransferase [Robbsia andropogonis]MCP1117496.1 protein-L-isoaspartate(D-aspartate) O-methyltransferase [Robbsia andropogonis]MCP1126962.1 protein-L-isoaspartate(D-aspartate) O-methyltransferase [Robbsia andropogonis]